MKHILLVDDSEVMRRMVKLSLRHVKEIVFEEANNGLEALERLAIAHVDLMILDLNMPDMHGLDVLKFVRKNRNLNAIPIIILTSRGDETIRATTLEAGASAYLTKPCEPHLLMGEVQKLLKLTIR